MRRLITMVITVITTARPLIQAVAAAADMNRPCTMGAMAVVRATAAALPKAQPIANM